MIQPAATLGYQSVPDEEVVELQHRWLGGRSGSDR